MFKRTIFLALLLSGIICLSFTFPERSEALAKSAATTTCTIIEYRYERIDGLCWLVEYCDGMAGNKIPASDSMCNP